MIPNQFITITFPIPQGHNFVVVTGQQIPFIPTFAYGYTQGDDGAVIWATAQTPTLSKTGGTFDLSGAPLDGNQILIATFAAYNPWAPPARLNRSPLSNIRSKLDRAVVAYLKSQGVSSYIVPANWSGIVNMDENPIWIVVRSHQGTPTTSLSSVWDFYVEVGVHGPACPPVDAVNEGQQRVDFDQVFAQMMDALMTTGQPDGPQDLQATADLITQYGRQLATNGDSTSQANNADMVDFTCQYWYPPVSLDGGNPRVQGAEANTTVWKEFATFKAVCSPFNVDDLQ